MAQRSAERPIDYPTGDESGMSLIGSRRVFTGPEGYRVQFLGGEGERCWGVLRYVGAHTRVVYGGRDLTVDGAHAYAARLSGRSVPPPAEVSA